MPFHAPAPAAAPARTSVRLALRAAGVLAASLALAACGDAGAPPTAPTVGSGAAGAPAARTGPAPSAGPVGGIEGVIESTTAAPSAGRTSISGASYQRSAAGGSAAAGTADGHVIAVARVKGDGTLEVLRRAGVGSDGSFRLDSVPAGVDRLVLVATTVAGAEVGRAIVHQAVAPGQVAAAAPIDGESTVEAHVFAQLVKGGMPKEAVNTVELARSIVASGPTAADALLASTADLRALAEGVKARQETYTRALAQQGIGLDAAQRFAAELPAAAAYAHDRRVRGYAAGAEHRADSAVAALLRARGASDAAQAQALGAAETGMLRAAAAASSNARLDLARAAAGRSGVARQRVVDSALTALALPAGTTDAIQQSFARARSAADSASSAASLRAAFAASADSAQAAFERSLAAATSRVPAAAQARLAAALRNAPSTSTLESRLAAASGANATAAAYVGFVSELRAAVQTAVAQAGGGLDGRAVADLFVAMRAGVRTP